MKQTTERTKTMKKLLFAMLAMLAVVFLSVGCDLSSSSQQEAKEEVKEETPEERYERLMTEAENSPEVETDLFLGFKFGMTQKQVDSVFADLKSKGMKVTSNDIFSRCTIKIEGKDTEITIWPDYYNERLFYMSYNMESLEAFHKLEILFLESDRYKNSKFVGIDMKTDACLRHFMYIKDNLGISFYYSEDSGMISYKNIPLTRKHDRELKEKREAEKEKLKSMF